METLPRGAIPGVTKVSKTLFLDLLNPAFGLAGPSFPEKIEGLAFGPSFGGARTLIVSSDNDFSTNPSVLYVFAETPEPATYALCGAVLVMLAALRTRAGARR